MAKILGVGIATLDIINSVGDFPAEDSEVRALEQNIRRGGNVTNTLAILSQLGHQCYWAGTLANESDTQLITSDLERYKINIEYANTFNTGKIPTSYITLNQSNGSRTIVHYRDLPELSFNDFKKIDLSEIDWIHFEARNIEHTLQMLQYTKANYPELRISIEFEKNRTNISDLYSYADVLIFSKSYCINLKQYDPVNFINNLNRSLTNKTIVVPWGEDGSYGSTDSSKVIYLPAISNKAIIDTVGAGDTFNAGIINSEIKGDDLKNGLIKSNKLASYKISNFGFDISNYDE